MTRRNAPNQPRPDGDKPIARINDLAVSFDNGRGPRVQAVDGFGNLVNVMLGQQIADNAAHCLLIVDDHDAKRLCGIVGHVDRN